MNMLLRQILLKRLKFAHFRNYYPTCLQGVSIVPPISQKPFSFGYFHYAALHAKANRLLTPQRESKNPKDEIYRSSYAIALVETFDLSDDAATDLVNSMEDIHRTEINNFKQSLQVLKAAGVKKDNLFMNPSLCCISCDKLKLHMQSFTTTLKLDNLSVLPLLEIIEIVNEYIRDNLYKDLKILGSNRIHFFSDKFSVGLQESASWFKVHDFMFRLPSSRIVGHYNFARSCNISPQCIMQDPQFFRHSAQFLQSRLKRLKVLDVNVTARLIRSVDSEISRIPQYAHHSWVDLFAHVLQCDQLPVLDVCARWPRVKKIKIERVEELSYLLEKYGLTRKLILQCPYMLWHSPQKIVERILMLQNAGLTSQEIESNYNLLVQNKSRFTKFLVRNIKLKSTTDS